MYVLGILLWSLEFPAHKARASLKALRPAMPMTHRLEFPAHKARASLKDAPSVRVEFRSIEFPAHKARASLKGPAVPGLRDAVARSFPRIKRGPH